MKLIKTTEALGHVLCHDLTQIIVGKQKVVVFKKGHVVKEEDIPILQSIGKEHLYIWEYKEGMLHENEAAKILCKLCENKNIRPTDVKEGKIELTADIDGVLKIDIERLDQLNALGEMIIATRHNNFAVKKGDKIAGTRIIPLVIEQEKMDKAKAIIGKKSLMDILSYKQKKVGIIITGNEVYYGRIKDTFGPVIHKKLARYDVEVIGEEISNDHPEKTTKLIIDFINRGANFVICTGGMSVDPDDTTPAAIKNTGAKIISYGVPVLPGAMFLLAYYNENIPILGLPGCVMYERKTIFDLILPRIMADDTLTEKDLLSLGHGGLCLSCNSCTFPNCGFGK